MEINNRNIFPLMHCGVYYDGFLWGSRKFGMDLICIDVSTGEVKFDDFFDKPYKSICMFETVIFHDGKLIFIPGLSEYIVIYDINNKGSRYIPYDDEGEKRDDKYRYYEIYNNIAFVFPIRMKHILKIDLNTMEVTKIESPFLEVGDKLDNDLMFGDGVRLSEEKVILRLVNKNIFFKFNLKTCEYKWIYGQAYDVNIGRIYKNKDDDFLIGNGAGGKIYRIDSKGYKEIYNGKEQYSNLIIDNNMIWAIPSFKGKIKLIDLVSQNVETYEYDKEFEYSLELDTSRFKNIPVTKSIIKGGDKIYIIPRFTNMLVSIDVINKKVECKRLWANEGNLKKLNLSEGNYEKAAILKTESDGYRLDSLLHDVYIFKNIDKDTDTISCGTKIYNAI